MHEYWKTPEVIDRRNLLSSLAVGGIAMTSAARNSSALASAIPSNPAQSGFESRTVYAPEDEYPLPPENRGIYNTETYNNWYYDPATDVGLNFWLGAGDGVNKRSLLNFTSNVSMYHGGEVFRAIVSSAPHQLEGHAINHANGVASGNAFLTIEEPFKRLKYEYLGLFSCDCGGDARLGQMDLVANLISPPTEQGSQGDRGEIASSGSKPRTSIRYEQLGRVTGKIRIGDTIKTIDAFGVRSHRRNNASIYESGAIGSSWFVALFPSGKGFHIMHYRLPYGAGKDFLYGQYFDGEQYQPIDVLRFPYYQSTDREDQFELELRIDGKHKVVKVTTRPPNLGKFPGVSRSSALGVFEMDGEIGGGPVEYTLLDGQQPGGEFIVR